MLHDHISRQERHRLRHPGLEGAFDYLLRFSPDTPDGRYPVDGDRVVALVQSYLTAPASEKPFEAHRRHIDLQYLVAGEEIVWYAPLPELSEQGPYHEEKDCQLYAPAGGQALRLSPGHFALLFPEDGHKPGCADGPARAVRKVVVKIRL